MLERLPFPAEFQKDRMNMYARAQHHLSKKVAKEIAIGASVCFLTLGLALAYAAYDTGSELSGATWVQTHSNITYTYTTQVRSGRTYIGFVVYLVSASYTYTSADGVSHQGHDYETISRAPSSLQPKTEEGTVYYDEKYPDVSYVFPLSAGIGIETWILVFSLIFIASIPLIVILESKETEDS